MPGLTYNSYVTSLANFMVVPVADVDFQAALPNIIDDAELRIYRDLDLLATSVNDSSAALTTGSRILALPTASGTFVVVEEINIITPAGTSNPEDGTRNPVQPLSLAALNMLYPSSTGSTLPVYFSRFNENAVAFGPWPDAAYQVEVIGTIRPNALSSTNVTTVLSVYFPDLLLAASMVIAAGYQKNFGSMVDDPKAAVSWEAHYQTLLKSADVEEMRKSFEGAGWSPNSPAPMATPPRT